MEENRGKQPVIPENIRAYLNEAQLLTLNKMESFGWELFFIRRPLFQETIAIMHFPSSGETALLEEDGNMNKAHDIFVRSEVDS